MRCGCSIRGLRFKIESFGVSRSQVEKFRKKLEKAKIHELKRKIASLGGDSSKCLEKKELVSLAVTLALNQLKEAEARKAAKQARYEATFYELVLLVMRVPTSTSRVVHTPARWMSNE